MVPSESDDVLAKDSPRSGRGRDNARPRKRRLLSTSDRQSVIPAYLLIDPVPDKPSTDPRCRTWANSVGHDGWASLA